MRKLKNKLVENYGSKAEATSVGQQPDKQANEENGKKSKVNAACNTLY